MNSFFSDKNIIQIGCILVLFIGIFCGCNTRPVAHLDETPITPHEKIEDSWKYYNGKSAEMKNLADKMVNDNQIIEKYLKSNASQDEKDEMFAKYLNNLQYYTENFSYANSGENNAEYILPTNKTLKDGEKCTISELEITPVFNEITPYNVNFPNLKITKPNLPFVKLVFSGWEDNNYFIPVEQRTQTVRSFELEPNYEYLSNNYSQYLSYGWKAYFDIKIKQQHDLRNGKFWNGNGQTGPYYIKNNDIKVWVKLWINFVNKYPDFPMKAEIKSTFIDLLYHRITDNDEALIDRLNNKQMADEIKAVLREAT